MKKIAFFSGDITRSGGTEKVAIQIMNGLCHEYEIMVISLTEASDNCFYSIDSGIQRLKLFEVNPSGTKDYFKIVKKLKKILLDHSIDIIVDIDTILDMFTVSAIKHTKVKLIAWEHFNFYESMGNRYRLFIRKHFTKNADVIVTLTKEDQDNYLHELGNKINVTQIYNPIEIPKNIHYDVDSKQIVSVGRLAKQKGFDYLVDVASIVLKQYPDWSWIILGEGEEREYLEHLIEDNNVNNLKLLGKVNNVNDYLQSSSIYVLTSRYEGFPLVLIEAKANKLPVVSFKCKTGPSELVQDNLNGYLIDCFDTDTMANKICELIENKEKRISFSNNAQLDTEKMEYGRIIDQWKHLINSLG